MNDHDFSDIKKLIEHSHVTQAEVVSKLFSSMEKKLDKMDTKLNKLENDLVREQEANKRFEGYANSIGKVLMYLVLAILGWAGVTLLNK